MTQTTYFFDTGDRDERARLEAQTALWDDFTFRKLAETGVAEGWRCLEVGGGTGSVAAWLLDRVGSSGRVVATDVETRWLEQLDTPNLEVRRHDVVADPLEESAYNLIHTRLVLMHLPRRDEVVAKLASALRPGGWLVIDDYDLCTIASSDPPHAAWAAVADASKNVLQSVGADVNYGSKLPNVLRAAGLSHVSAEGRVLLRRPPEVADVLVPMLERMRQPIISANGAAAAVFDEVMRMFEDDASPLCVSLPILVSTRGRRNDTAIRRDAHDTPSE